MYVCLSRFWNVIKAQRMHDSNSICTANMYAYCVRASACMHALQLMYQYLDYNEALAKSDNL